MMRNYADEDNLHARIYAMRGRLLTLRDYDAMIRDEQRAELKPSGDSDWVEVRENLFREQIVPVIAIAAAFDKYEPLFLAYLRQFETRNAKMLLARAWGKKSLEMWYDTGPFATLDKELLKKNMSPDEIKALIAGTFLPDDLKDDRDYLRMEINLDVSAAMNLYHSSTLLSSGSKKEFQEMALWRIAVMTVIWSYRLKEYYHLSREQIHFYLEKLQNLFDGQAPSHVSLVEEELNRNLEQIRRGGGKEPGVVDIESRLEQGYYDRVSYMFHRDFHSMYCVVSYLWLLFYQIKNLFCIIDGRRFGMQAEAILNKMICQR
ncbi:MAG TPA: V-type ATPase subunit [Smithella sp.]|nr:V-type ATPase subunit [Smithella sp.]